jgi:hypothetical protein
VVKPQVAGTIQYTEWLILNERVQPSLIAGVKGLYVFHEQTAVSHCHRLGSQRYR